MLRVEADRDLGVRLLDAPREELAAREDRVPGPARDGEGHGFLGANLATNLSHVREVKFVKRCQNKPFSDDMWSKVHQCISKSYITFWLITELSFCVCVCFFSGGEMCESRGSKKIL